jgi:4-amino-4-deoxy-L-arabinose transferase-like glycosyltransferase
LTPKSPATIYAIQARPSSFIKLCIFGVLLLFALVYVGSLFSPGLQDDADSTHAEAAREMLLTHDYVTLKVNGNRYLEKAPLMYWAVSLSYLCFGINEFAVHLPIVVSMLLLVLLAMRWGRRAFGDRAGIYVGLFISTAAGCYLFTRVLIPESILSLFIAASFYLFATALEEGDAWRWYGGYACMALAVLTKGLLAIVVVGLALLLYAAISGEWQRWREFHLFTGSLLFLLIAAPWHILAGLRNPHFFWFYFVNEHFMRFLGKRIPRDYNMQTSSLYWCLRLVWRFPWSL